MALDSLGYFGVRTRSLDDWSRFGEKFLGLQLVDRSKKTLTFRMDDRLSAPPRHSPERRRTRR